MFERIFLSVLAGVMMLTVAGCELFNPIGPILQIGISWIEGESHKYYNVDQSTLLSSTKSALDDLEFPIQEERESGNVVRIRAGDPGEDRFKIKVTAIRHNVSKLSIRVNIMGDKPYAEMIYRHVDSQPDMKQFTTVAELNDAVE